jgi:teichuronic acid exporter
MNKAKSLVVTGVFWSGVQLVVNQSFTFIVKLVLAKILFPKEFGIIGMATIFTGFVQVFNDLGIGAALVQKKDEHLRESHFQTAFWTGVFWGIGLYVVMSVAIAPLAAAFYHEALLTKLIPVLSIGVLSTPINMVHKAQLTKQMNFKKIAFIDNTSNIIAGTLSLILAFTGFGVWSLAFNSVASLLIAVPLYFNATKWTPKFIWEKAAFKDVFGFGVYTTGTNVVNYLINNIDYLTIGKLLSAQLLGAYTFAFVLTDTFRSRLMSVINNVMYPFYAKNQSDKVLLKKYYLLVVNYNSVAVYPIMTFMFALGEPFVLHVFGQKWVDSIEPLKILSLAVMVHMLVNSNTALIRGMGRPGLAILINKFIAVLIAQYTFNYLINIKVTTREFINAIKVPWISSLVAFGVAYLMFNVLHIHYILAGVIMFISYSLIIWLLMGEEIKKQVNEYRSKKKISV